MIHKEKMGVGLLGGDGYEAGGEDRMRMRKMMMEKARKRSKKKGSCRK